MTSPQEYITFTDSVLRDFKHAYANAIASGAESFTFQHHEFLTTYAKFMLEYLALHASNHNEH